VLASAFWGPLSFPSPSSAPKSKLLCPVSWRAYSAISKWGKQYVVGCDILRLLLTGKAKYCANVEVNNEMEVVLDGWCLMELGHWKPPVPAYTPLEPYRVKRRRSMLGAWLPNARARV
jgi:hypothetical protein